MSEGFTLLQKPDGTVKKVANELVDAAITKYGYVAPGTSEKDVERAELKAATKRPASMTERLALPFGQGASMGFSDELTGLVGGDYARDYQRARTQAVSDQYPISSTVTEIAGALPTAAKSAAALGMGAIKTGALQGAATGLGKSEDKGVRDALIGGAIGAAIPTALGGVRALGRMGAEKIKPENLINARNEQALRATNIKLNDLRNLGEDPLEFGGKIYESGLVKAGRNLEDVNEDLAGRLARSGKQIGEIESIVGNEPVSRPDLFKALQKLGATERTKARYNPDAEYLGGQYKEATRPYMKKIVENPNVTVSETLDLKRTLDNAKIFDKPREMLTQNDKLIKQDIRKVMKEASDAAITKRGGDDLGKAWRAANDEYSFLSKVGGISEDESLRNIANRNISPSTYGALIAGSAENTGTGILMAMANKFGLERGNTILAKSLDSMARWSASQPGQIGRDLAERVGKAATSDPAKIGAIHSMLMLTEPSYRTIHLRRENKK